MKISQVVDILNNYAPLELSSEFVSKYEAYDNSGIIVDLKDEISGILFSLDLTETAVKKAKEEGCNLIITHHPAIYKPILKIEGALLKAINYGMGVISYHLNLDVCEFGIDYHLAKALGADSEEILMPLSLGGYGRIFNLKNAKFCDVIETYKNNFNSKKVFAYGNLEDAVKTVASLCGSGVDDNVIEVAKHADLIISADVSHHRILKILENGKKLMVVTHYSSEFYGFKKFYESVCKSFENIKTVINCEKEYL